MAPGRSRASPSSAARPEPQPAQAVEEPDVATATTGPVAPVPHDRQPYDPPYQQPFGQPFDQPFDEDISEHDTVVLGRTDDGEGDDPRVSIPAWEDIVFGIRRHR